MKKDVFADIINTNLISSKDGTIDRNFISGFTPLSKQKLGSYWVTGITDAEGNFSIHKQKTKKGYKLSLAFKITQKNHSMGILYDLKIFFLVVIYT